MTDRPTLVYVRGPLYTSSMLAWHKMDSLVRYNLTIHVAFEFCCRGTRPGQNWPESMPIQVTRGAGGAFSPPGR